MRTPCARSLAPAAIVMLSSLATAQPRLPDWTAATFDSDSASITNQLFPHPVGLRSTYEGVVDGELERLVAIATADTRSILGVDTRVIRDTAFKDGRLVEVADDWYGQDTDGNVWYFGEFVVNYRYDQNGNFTGTDNAGSWIADGTTNLPGVIMFADPILGDEYYQEYAPGVAFDFAIVNSLTDTVDIDFGFFTGVLNTGEGNLFDGPEIVENKLYAPGIGLVLIQHLDDLGDPEFEVELIDQRFIPAPGALPLAACAMAFAARRRGVGRSRDLASTIVGLMTRGRAY